MQAEIIYMFYHGFEILKISQRVKLPVSYVTQTINNYLKPSRENGYEIYESAMNFD